MATETEAIINATVDDGGTINATVENGSSIEATVTGGAQGPPGQSIVGPPGPQGPPGPAGSVTDYLFNVKDYGAQGNGTHDDTAAINATVAAAKVNGGTVFFPVGTYPLSDEIQLYTGVSVEGVGSEATTIIQTLTGKRGFIANDAASIGLFGFLLQGPGNTTGNYNGIDFGWTTAENVPFLNFRDVKVHNFGEDGIALETPIVSVFEDVVVQNCGAFGFNLYHGGTSCTFISCWARENAKAGYHFYESIYCDLIGCAADDNGMSYLVESANAINFFGCGSESPLVNGMIGGVNWDGTSFKISNSSACSIYGAYIGQNPGIGIHITDGTRAMTIIGATDNSPTGSATAFVQTDVSTNSTLSSIDNTTANSYSPGTVTILNDGANGMLTKQMTVKDSSGSLIMTAASDGIGGNYTIQADTTGTLDIFGQGGQALNVHLVDGLLTLDAGIKITSGTPGSGKVLTSDASGNGTWQANAALTNPMTTLGDLIYENSTPAATRLAGNTTTTKKYLQQVGNGTISAAPSWQQIAIGDLASMTSSALASQVSDETGSGSLVFANTPTLVTPALGAATATSINGLTITSTTGTLTLVNGSSLITAGAFALTLTTSATTNVTFPSGTFTVAGISSTQTLTNKTITGLKLTAGTTTVAPLTIASGTNLTTAVSGAIEYDGTNLYYTSSTPTRHTLAIRDAAQTFTGVQTFSSAPVFSSITNTGTLTLPTSTDTLIGRATTDTLTNKTYDTAGTGNVFKINGTAISAVTGTGAVVLANTPTLITPVIGAATGTSLTLSGTMQALETDIAGPNGTLAIYASTDASEFNFRSNATGTLSFFGSGSNTLHVNLFDGNFSVAAGTTTLQSIATAVVAKSAAYTIGATDHTILATASTAYTVTLPTAVGIAGREYTIKKVDSSANAITVGTTSSQTIDGATTKSLGTQYKYITVQSDGANWWIIANN